MKNKEMKTVKKENEQTISVEHLTKNPRINKFEVKEQKFFAYEKQRAHH